MLCTQAVRPNGRRSRYSRSRSSNSMGMLPTKRRVWNRRATRIELKICISVKETCAVATVLTSVFLEARAAASRAGLRTSTLTMAYSISDVKTNVRQTIIQTSIALM